MRFQRPNDGPTFRIPMLQSNKLLLWRDLSPWQWNYHSFLSPSDCCLEDNNGVDDIRWQFLFRSLNDDICNCLTAGPILYPISSPDDLLINISQYRKFDKKWEMLEGMACWLPVWYCYSGLIGRGWGVALSGPSDLLSSPCSPPVQFPELFLHAHPASAQTVFSSFQHFPRIIYWGQLQLSSTQYKICTILVKDIIVKTCMAFINVEKN